MSFLPDGFPKRLFKRHNVFISFHHKDIIQKWLFETKFGHLFINKSVKLGGIATDISNEYIKRLIREDHISGSSVVIVLVGSETYCRKHVDWEISAGLSSKAGGPSGLLGIRIPSHPDFSSQYYFEDNTPPRLYDNLESGYANLYNWTDDSSRIQNWIEEAFQSRINKTGLIRNWRLQFERNRFPNLSRRNLF